MVYHNGEKVLIRNNADVLRAVTIAMMLVFETVGGLSTSSTIATRWGKWGKTMSKPVMQMAHEMVCVRRSSWQDLWCYRHWKR